MIRSMPVAIPVPGVGGPKQHRPAQIRLLDAVQVDDQQVISFEKCRDRLYPEFVLGGVALPTSAEGYRKVIYASGLDLLRQTPGFMEQVRAKRLDGEFESAYRYLEILFNGRNPYIEAIERNLAFLKEILRSESWRMLRRNPPVFAAVPDPVGNMRGLMAGYIRKVWTED